MTTFVVMKGLGEAAAAQLAGAKAMLLAMILCGSKLDVPLSYHLKVIFGLLHDTV